MMCECGRGREGGREGGREQTHMIYNKPPTRAAVAKGERDERARRAPAYNSTDSRQSKSRKRAERELE